MKSNPKKERGKQGKELQQHHASELEWTEIHLRNERKWNPIIAWQDYEDANHCKREILEVWCQIPKEMELYFLWSYQVCAQQYEAIEHNI